MLSDIFFSTFLRASTFHLIRTLRGSASYPRVRGLAGAHNVDATGRLSVDTGHSNMASTKKGVSHDG